MKVYKSLLMIGAAVLVGSLAGCGGDDASSSAQNANPVSRSATAPPAIAAPLSVIQQAGSPSISGTPAPSVVAGSPYDFVPTASDPSGNTLSFSIQNKPAWASFNIMTGELTGTPAESDVGVYSDIVISASDSAASSALTAFSVQVTSTTGASSTPTVSSSSTSVSSSVAVPVVATSTPASTSAVSAAVVTPVTSGLPSSSGSASSSTASSGGTSNSSSSSATSSSSSTGSSTGSSASGAPQYPRLSWENGYGNNGRPEVIARSAHLDVVVLGDTFEGAAADGGYNRGTVVNQMHAGDGAVVPKVQQYVLDSYFSPAQQSGSLDPIWSAQMAAMANYWFLYNGSGHTYTDDAPSNTNWAYNPVDQGPAGEDANGNNVEAAFAKYVDSQYRTGNSADAAPNLSGPWHDNITASGWYFASGGNWLGGSTVYNNNDVTAMAAARAGQARFVTWYRNNAPTQFVMGNVNVLGDLSDMPGVPLYHRPASVMTSLNGVLDAAMVESAFGPLSTEHYGGFEETRKLVQYMEGAVKSPAYNMIVHDGVNLSSSSSGGICSGCDSDLNASAGQALRYSFCGTLTIASGTHAVLDDLFWFDYYAVNPSTGVALDYASSTSAQIGASRYWLGTPIDAIQTAPTQGKVYARRFRMPNGRTALVLVNPSANGNTGAAPQTINLTAAFGGSWTHITASNGTNVGINSQVDNGATVTSVTVPVGDGMILIQ